MEKSSRRLPRSTEELGQGAHIVGGVLTDLISTAMLIKGYEADPSTPQGVTTSLKVFYVLRARSLIELFFNAPNVRNPSHIHASDWISGWSKSRFDKNTLEFKQNVYGELSSTPVHLQWGQQEFPVVLDEALSKGMIGKSLKLICDGMIQFLNELDTVHPDSKQIISHYLDDALEQAKQYHAQEN